MSSLQFFNFIQDIPSYFIFQHLRCTCHQPLSAADFSWGKSHKMFNIIKPTKSVLLLLLLLLLLGGPPGSQFFRIITPT